MPVISPSVCPFEVSLRRSSIMPGTLANWMSMICAIWARFCLGSSMSR